MSASEMGRLRAELAEQIEAKEAAYQKLYVAQAAQSQVLEALLEAREHMIGRALCDDACETLRMVDAALSGSSAPQVAAPEEITKALQEIAARADEQAGAFAIRADEDGDGHRIAAGRGTDAQHQRHLASIAFMGIARKARAALSMKSEGPAAPEDAEGGGR